MYLKHIKFTLAVVLYTLILPLAYGCAKLTNRYEPMSFSDLKDVYVSLRDDIYFK